jgi:hypothetical protein
MLLLFTRYQNRVVGVASVNRARTLVRLGHLSLFGRRKDVLVPVADLIPLMETSDAQTGVPFLRLCWTDSDGEGYFFPIFANISRKNCQKMLPIWKIISKKIAKIYFSNFDKFSKFRKNALKIKKIAKKFSPKILKKIVKFYKIK